MDIVANHDETVWNGCSVHAVFCDCMAGLLLQQVAVDGHLGHGMADDEDFRRPQAVVLFQTIVEQLETEDVGDDEDQKPG